MPDHRSLSILRSEDVIVKKFFGKSLVFFVLLAASVITLNFLYINTNYWKNTVVIERFKNIPEGIQLANVGSSHGLRSFDYSGVPYRSFNFALNSQRFLYDYAIIKQYVNKFNKNAVLLIPISYFEITQIKTNFKDQRARYYHFLDKEYMDYYSIQEKILFTHIPVLTAGTTLRFIIKDQRSSITISRAAKEPDLTKYCINKHKSWTSNRRAGIETREKGFVHNKFLVSQMVEFCYAHDIQPVLVTTPITSVLNNIFLEKTPDFFDDFYRFKRELQEDYPSLPYFDYSHDPRFENDFSLFYNGDHLNTHGAKKFTAVVISDLQASGLLAFDETSR